MKKVKSYFTKSKQKQGEDNPRIKSSDETASELLVVAFDFGTTYSGYAFSFRDDPLKVQTNQGWSSSSSQLITSKTPTCILLNKNKEFDSFGFDAENKFANLAEDNKHHGWLLFRRFKMILHKNEGGSHLKMMKGVEEGVKPSDVTSIEGIIKEDARVTVKEISEVTWMSYGTTHTIITKELNMRKVHARWVPRLLTDVEMKKRVQESRRVLRRFRSNPDFLNYVIMITTDETWLYLRDPETKAQSALWRQANSPPPVKARVGRSAGKQMYMMFVDCRGMLLCHAVPVGTTINANYYSKNLSRSTTVEDINGNSMPALTIFTMSIKYLKEHFWMALNKQKVGIKDEDVKYVITVPAIWNDNAKQFMREAAEKAGIAKSRLKLCFEPEAASIWCQTIYTSVRESLSKRGKQYMVIDLGGGTADISVHEKLIDGSLKELHKASGGPWGGTVVDDNFLEWLTEIFGESTMQRFKEAQMEDYFELLRDFEIKKRNIETNSEGNVTIRLPVSLKELYDEKNSTPLQSRIVEMGLAGKVTLTGEKLRVEAVLIKQLFDSPINSVIKHATQILSKPYMQNVETILLVGGFGECKYIQDLIQKAMHDRKIIIPEGPGLVVLKGAVRFGHFPYIVHTRIMTQTYGVKVVDRRNYVGNVFDIIIRVGEETSKRKTITKGPYEPLGLHKSHFEIYTTEKVDPEFVTDPGCRQIGRLTVLHSNGRCQNDNKVMASFIFGDTELFVKAVNIRTREEFSTYIDCL